MSFEAPVSILERMGYSYEQIANLAHLGLVYSGVSVENIDGRLTDCLAFEFIADSPLGRAKDMCGEDDWDTLSLCVEDAKTLNRISFADKYPSLAPYPHDATVY